MAQQPRPDMHHICPEIAPHIRRIERRRIATIIAWSIVAFLIGFIAGVLI